MAMRGHVLVIPGGGSFPGRDALTDGFGGFVGHVHSSSPFSEAASLLSSSLFHFDLSLQLMPKDVALLLTGAIASK